MKKILLGTLMLLGWAGFLSAQQVEALPQLELEGELIDEARTIDGAADIVLGKGTRIVSPVKVMVHGCHSIRFEEGFQMVPGTELVARVDESCKQGSEAIAPVLSSEVSLGPNPFQNVLYLTIETANGIEVAASLLDLQGRQVAELIPGQRMENGQHKIEFDLGHLPAGTYFYRVNAGGELFSGKLVHLN